MAWDSHTWLHTTDADFYRWNQWLFLTLHRHGLAYRAEAEVNWCPDDRTVLANEQVIAGRCERCGATVVPRSLTQWFFRTTAYAQRLRDDLDRLTGWPPPVVRMQRHWLANLRDWLISRQRYWGTPIPIVHCPTCGEVPVPANDLPVLLPESGYDLAPADGRSPLATADEWRSVECPRCGGRAARDTDTMDTFVDSSWYFLRYPNPSYTEGPFDPAGIAKWLPVDEYIGGRSHATGHLIYARFITKVLCDLGFLPFDEPFLRLTTQGEVILGGRSMSKSRGNLVSLQEQIEAYGPDAVRVTMLFAGPPQDDIDWADVVPAAAVNWLARVDRLVDRIANSPVATVETFTGDTGGVDPADAEVDPVTRLIAETTGAMDAHRFNVAIARLMELTTALRKTPSRNGIRALLRMLWCFAPATAEAGWSRLGRRVPIVEMGWPITDPALLPATTTCVVQVDGRRKDRLAVASGVPDDDLRELALASPKVIEALAGRRISRVIVRPPRLVNIVTTGDSYT